MKEHFDGNGCIGCPSSWLTLEFKISKRGRDVEREREKGMVISQTSDIGLMVF